MLVLITIAVNIPLASAEAKNYTYWAYVPNPLLLRPVNWSEVSIPVYVNDSSWSRRQAFAHSSKGRGDLLYFIFLYKCIYFNWRLITLQYGGDFCRISTWISHRYTYVPSLLNLPFSSPHHPSRLSQSTSFVSLYHMANFPCLSALHMIIYVFQCYSLNSSHPLLPQLCP